MAKLVKVLGRRIQQLRTAADLTQQQLADQARIDVKYVADLEHGRRSPSLDVLGRLMEALDVAPSDLFAFKLKGKNPRGNRTSEVVAALLQRATSADKRLIVDLVRTVVRSRKSDKK